MRACGVPASIIRVGRITDAPGGMQQLRIMQVLIHSVMRCIAAYKVFTIPRCRLEQSQEEWYGTQDGHEEQQLGDVSREDLARVLAQCAEQTPAGCLTVAVEGGPPADVPQQDIGQLLEGVYAAGAH